MQSNPEQVEINKKVKNTGILMLVAMLFVVFAWVFFVLSAPEKAQQMISKDSSIFTNSRVSELGDEINVIGEELIIFEEDLNYDLNADFSF